ncbi:hypothetical protein HYH02_007874 [Chlamydomonas schloesseri]|uniref:Defective in cullin neddylation protein n=1 Tax=Chlamydomonas schloesseri TaxID=2026947 RepID=A0A836B4G1_9CHLO|nr:hypothetical protein HYH02_007874 [Chlamydomonas schloesseri]|eukprot:KAG2447128.1 hypothetical protein HYH02_007874 [Chlamydomonas schloesseri]
MPPKKGAAKGGGKGKAAATPAKGRGRGKKAEEPPSEAAADAPHPEAANGAAGSSPSSAGGAGSPPGVVHTTQTKVKAPALSKLNKAQKAMLSEFRSATGASDKVGLECLAEAQFDVEKAVDHFFTSGAADQAGSRGGRRAAEALYRRYKEPGEEHIGVDGVQRFCEDLGVEPADIVMLVISYHMGAAVMCEYSQEEFVSGLVKLGAETLARLRAKLPELRASLAKPDTFRAVYAFAYDFSREKGQKCVQLDSAVGMWRLLLESPHAGPNAWPLVEDWVGFLEARHANRAIAKDTWQQLLDFIRSVKPDFSNFDENSAWPYLLDEFVEHMREKRAAGATA